LVGIDQAKANHHEANHREESPGELLIFVAPDGKDTQAGSKELPLRTLEAARNALRADRARGGEAQAASVILRGGVYHLSRSFRLNKEDSGTSDARVTYRAYPDEKVRILGGFQLQIDQFSPVADPDVRRRFIDQDALTHILEIDLGKLGITQYGRLSRRGFYRASELSETPPMELFLNSKPMQIARWPNQETVQMNEILDPGPLAVPETKPEKGNTISAEKNPAYARMIAHLTDGATRGRIPAPSLEWVDNAPDLHKRGGTFSYDYSRPELWAEAKDIWITGIFGFSWSWSYNRVAAINSEAKTITLAHGEMYGIQKNWFDDFHHFENLLEEIDQAGEYYIDRQTGMLYFYPPSENWHEGTDITVSTADFPLIDFNNVSFVTLQGIDLGTGRKEAVVVNGGEDNQFVGLEICNVTGRGISINSGRNHAVIACHLHHIGSTGILLGGGNWKTLDPAGNRVEDSIIHDIAYFDRAYNAGVIISNRAVGNIIANNRIYDLPHVAIIIQGNNHLVEGNEIFRVCTDFSDMGAVYLNTGLKPAERGTLIRRNYFHSIGHEKSHVFAVYPDNQSMGLIIEENIFFKMGSAAINVNSGSWIEVRHNLFVDVPTPLRHSYHSFGASDYSAVWQSYFDEHDFTTMPHGKQYPELLAFFEEARNPSDSNTFIGNIIYNPHASLSSKDGVEHPKKNLLIAKNNMILGDDNGYLRVVDGTLDLLDPVGLSQLVPDFPVLSIHSND